MTLTIRPTEAHDEAAWRRLWTGYLEFYETSVPEEVYQTTFARILSDDDTMPRGLIALNESGAVGLAHYMFHPHCWKVEKVCYLQDLYAAPEARGQSVGRKLTEAVYAAADEAGAPAVYWLTQDFNERARVLYDRIGKVTPFIRYNRA